MNVLSDAARAELVTTLGRLQVQLHQVEANLEAAHNAVKQQREEQRILVERMSQVRDLLEPVAEPIPL